MHYILYATDANYWMHLYVSLYSLLKNNKETKFMVYILTDQLNKTFIKYLPFLMKMNNLVDCKIIQMDSCLASSFPLNYNLPKTIYYRFFIAQALPDEVDEVLYLDCDTIIVASLTPLFEIDLQECVLGAVPDTMSKINSERLHLPQGIKYFNSGVLFINMKKWRSMNIESRLLDYIENNHNKIIHHDQDVLNMVLYNDYKEISPQFNFQEPENKTNKQKDRFEIYPTIVHFTSWKHKPWLYLSEHSYKKQYWSYLKETPYSKYRVKDRNLKNIFIKSWNKVYNMLYMILINIPFMHHLLKRLRSLFK